MANQSDKSKISNYDNNKKKLIQQPSVAAGFYLPTMERIITTKSKMFHATVKK